MITIDGLTQRQKQIMDLIWACDTEEEAANVILSLPTARDQWEGASLMRILIHEVLEQKGDLDVYLKDARDCINRARDNGLRPISKG